MIPTRINRGALWRKKCSRSRRSTKWSEKCAAIWSGTLTSKAKRSPSSSQGFERITAPLLHRDHPHHTTNVRHLHLLPLHTLLRTPLPTHPCLPDQSDRCHHLTKIERATRTPLLHYHHHPHLLVTTCDRRPHTHPLRILPRPTLH
jgi:hypothetical protein